MKTSNEYSKALPYFDRIPKHVLAAIALSYASAGGYNMEVAADNVAKEWQILFENGIVSQRPPSDVMVAAKRAADRESAG